MGFLYGMMNIELTLEQNGFELCGSTCTQSFFNSNTTTLYNPLLVESMDVDPWIQRTNYKLYANFQLHGGLAPLTLTLVMGQLYSKIDSGGG